MTSWVEIDEDRLTGNLGLLRRAAEAAAGGRAPEMLAVIKANGYGHGARVCAPVLARAGAAWLGVTDAAEGALVRTAMGEAGLARDGQPRVLVMCGMLPEDAATMVGEELTPVVWTREHIGWLAAAAESVRVRVHLEVDTGMSRQGAAPGEELGEVLRALRAEPRVELEAVMTHVASSEVAGSEQTRHQHGSFEAAMEQIRVAGFRPDWVHVGSTSTVDNDDAEGGDCAGSVEWLQRVASRGGARPMIRTGLGLYGYCLPIEGAGRCRVRTGVRPVMTWKTRVIAVREVGAGDAVGYNGAFVAERAMRLALLPVGYADGLRRELSSTNTREGGWVRLHGRAAAIVGRVSMNLTVVDVTAIVDATRTSEVRVGDEAVLLGDGVTADDHARLAETIAYEILCGVKAAAHLRGQVRGR